MAQIAIKTPPLGSMSLDRLPDERLAELAADGDGGAFAVLYARYEGPLRRYCRRILRNDDEVDDVVQATMTRAHAGLHQRRADGSWRGWIHRIAHNEAVDVVRRRPATTALHIVEDRTAAPADARLEQRERLRLLAEDLRDLPERQRRALVMRAVDGLAPDRIGEELSMSPGAVRQAIFEARTALNDFEEGRSWTCDLVRDTIASGDGRQLRERRIRAHLRSCADCRDLRAKTRRRLLWPALPFGWVVEALPLKALVVTSAIAVGVATTTPPPKAAPDDRSAPGARAEQPAAAIPAGPFATAPALFALPVPAATGAPALAAPRTAPQGRTPAATRTPGVAAPAAGSGPAVAQPGDPAAVVEESGATAGASGAAPAPADTTVTAPPQSGANPGHGGTPPGQGGTPPGQSGSGAPGQSGSAPGQTGAAPGQSGTNPGHGGAPPGQSGAAPGQSGTAPGQSGTAPGQPGTAPGHGGTAPGQSNAKSQGHDGTPPGQSGDAPGQAIEKPQGQGVAHGGSPKKQ